MTLLSFKGIVVRPVQDIEKIPDPVLKDEISSILEQFPELGNRSASLVVPYTRIKKNRKHSIILKGYKSWEWILGFNQEIQDFRHDDNVCYFKIRVEDPLLRGSSFFHVASGSSFDSTSLRELGRQYSGYFNKNSIYEFILMACISIDCSRKYLIVKSINAPHNKMLIIASGQGRGCWGTVIDKQ
jgi:hypothetical protein